MDVEEKLEDLMDSMEDIFKDRVHRLNFSRWDNDPKEKLIRVLTIFQFICLMMVVTKDLEKMKTAKNIEKLWNRLANHYKKADLIVKRIKSLFNPGWIKENFADVWVYWYWFTSLRKMLTADGEIKITANPRITKAQASKLMKSIKDTYKKDLSKAKNDQNKNVVTSIEGLYNFLLTINKDNALLGDNSIKAAMQKALATEKRMSGRGYK